MTTPESPEPTSERVTRPEAGQTAPIRHAASGGAGEPPVAPVLPNPGVQDPEVLKINETVASSVKSAYDVLGETIEQGRRAAEQFRVGAYNVRDVPDDVRHMATNLLGLARQLSTATFDICEALLRQAGGAMPPSPPPPGSTVVPPFPTPGNAAPPSSPAPTPPAPDMRLAVQFTGNTTARAHSTALARPAALTAPDQIACDGLTLRGGSAAPITEVGFAADPAGAGLVATVAVPQDQPAGIYAGAVYCPGQVLPLGQLVIEIG